MPRVKRGTKRRQRRKKILERASGYFLTKSKLHRAAKEAVERGLKFAYSGRKQKKRQYRSIWIVRIGAASRAQGISYNQFISGLKKAGVDWTARSWPILPRMTRRVLWRCAKPPSARIPKRHKQSLNHKGNKGTRRELQLQRKLHLSCSFCPLWFLMVFLCG